jgi:hypothetical protein
MPLRVGNSSTIKSIFVIAQQNEIEKKVFNRKSLSAGKGWRMREIELGSRYRNERTVLFLINKRLIDSVRLTNKRQQRKQA